MIEWLISRWNKWVLIGAFGITLILCIFLWAALSFFDFKDTPRGWVEDQYAKSGVAWVTADSVSMIYEALTAGCRVGILPVPWKNARNKFQRSIDFLLLKGLVKVYSPAESTSLLSMAEQNFNEADRCAEEILRKIQPTG